MRTLNILLGLMMLGFIGVQYNDDDGLLWACYYAVPAVLAFTVAFKSGFARSGLGSRLLWASVAVWFGLMVYYWPDMPNFWQPVVFHAHETAREGMGMMIAWVVVLVAALSAGATRPKA